MKRSKIVSSLIPRYLKSGASRVSKTMTKATSYLLLDRGGDICKPFNFYFTMNEDHVNVTDGR